MYCFPMVVGYVCRQKLFQALNWITTVLPNCSAGHEWPAVLRFIYSNHQRIYSPHVQWLQVSKEPFACESESPNLIPVPKNI